MVPVFSVNRKPRHPLSVKMETEVSGLLRGNRKEEAVWRKRQRIPSRRAQSASGHYHRLLSFSRSIPPILSALEQCRRRP